MIIDFSVGNYRSFSVVQTLSFKATGLTSSVDDDNIALPVDNSRLLKILGVYGANASGKSNLIKALNFFKSMVVSSLESEDVLRRGHNPFKLRGKTEDNDGYFQIILLLGTKRYRYGFTLGSSANIEHEWLFGPAEKNETYYFKRTGSEVITNSEYFREGDDLPKDKLRKDTLFLTFCTSYNGEISRTIRDFVGNKILIDSSISREYKGAKIVRADSFEREKTDALITGGQKRLVLAWLASAGILYTDVKIESLHLSKDWTIDQVKLEKTVYDSERALLGTVNMDLDDDESQGTKKYYSYIGELAELFVTGGVFISDEIDSNFHPALLKHLINMFQRSDINVSNAQLLFSSHDTNLMNPDIMRRDQFYFTEKTPFEDTRLYSLADLKGIRNNVDFARQYLSGFYGATPQLRNLKESLEQE